MRGIGLIPGELPEGTCPTWHRTSGVLEFGRYCFLFGILGLGGWAQRFREWASLQGSIFGSGPGVSDDLGSTDQPLTVVTIIRPTSLAL